MATMEPETIAARIADVYASRNQVESQRNRLLALKVELTSILTTEQSLSEALRPLLRATADEIEREAKYLLADLKSHTYEIGELIDALKSA